MMNPSGASMGPPPLPSPPTDVVALRKRAKLRCTLLPGCGFAVLGYGLAAWVGITINVLWILAIAAIPYWFSSTAVWVAIAVIAALVLFWLLELLMVGRLPIRRASTGIINRRFGWVFGLVLFGSYGGPAAALY